MMGKGYRLNKELTFLMDISVKVGENPSPLRKYKFLLGREKFLRIFRIFLFKKSDDLKKKKSIFADMSVKVLADMSAKDFGTLAIMSI